MSAAGLCIHQQCHPVPFSVVYHTWAGSLDSHTGAWEAWLRLDFHQTSPKCWPDRWNKNNRFLNVGMIFGFFKPETMCQMLEVKGFNDDLSNVLNSVYIDDCTPLNENSECLATLTRSGTGDGSNCPARFGRFNIIMQGTQNSRCMQMYKTTCEQLIWGHIVSLTSLVDPCGCSGC